MESNKNFDSKFRFVIICAKRAKQILRGSKVLVDQKAENPLTLALAELESGLVTLDNINALEKEKVIFSNIGDNDEEEPSLEGTEEETEEQNNEESEVVTNDSDQDAEKPKEEE